MSSTRYSPWERATRGQAAAMAAAHAAQQMQQNQLAEFGGRVRHWERSQVLVHAQQGFGPGGETLHLGGFKVTKWMATDAPLAQEYCQPPKGIVPVKVPFKRARSPTPDPEEQTAKLPPRRSSRLSMSQLAEQGGSRPGTPLPVISAPTPTPPSTSFQPVQPADPATTPLSLPEEKKMEEVAAVVPAKDKDEETEKEKEKEKEKQAMQTQPVVSVASDAPHQSQSPASASAPTPEAPAGAKEGPPDLQKQAAEAPTSSTQPEDVTPPINTEKSVGVGGEGNEQGIVAQQEPKEERNEAQG